MLKVDEVENRRGRSLGSDGNDLANTAHFCTYHMFNLTHRHSHQSHSHSLTHTIFIAPPHPEQYTSISLSHHPNLLNPIQTPDRYLAGTESTQALGTPPRRGVAWHLTEVDPGRCQLLSMIFKILRLVQIVAPPPSIIPLLPRLAPNHLRRL